MGEQLNENQLKQNVAANLVHYRKLANITQVELAAMLNYSDKAISKWERGESIPDVFVLQRIAKLYKLTVDDLLQPQQLKKLPYERVSKIVVAVLCGFFVWLIGAVVFAYLIVFHPEISNPWMVFIYCVPLSGMLMFIFGYIWHKRVLQGVSVSMVIWGLTFSIWLSTKYIIEEFWIILIIVVPLQIIAVLGFFLRHLLISSKKTKLKKETNRQLQLQEENKENNKAQK